MTAPTTPADAESVAPDDFAELLLGQVIAAKGGARRSGQVGMARHVAQSLAAKTPLLIQGGTGIGKALDVTTPIPTPNGFVPMGKLKVGDLVFNEVGDPVRVTHAFRVRHGRPCFEITFNDGSTLIADGEHQWDVVPRGWATNTDDPWGKARTLTTTQLLASMGTDGRREYRIPVAKALHTPGTGADLPVDPYTLGLWLAGTGDTPGMAVCAASTLTPGSSADGFTVGSRGKRISLRPDAEMLATLRSLGVDGAAARMPSSYLFAAHDDRRALFAGLLDAGAYTTGYTHTQIVFYDHRQGLVEDFQTLAATLGYRAKMRKHSAKRGWTATLSTSDPLFRARRKQQQHDTSQQVRRATVRTIVSIVPVESRPVRCISVDSPRHLYLAGTSLIPTHNSLAYLVGALASRKQVVVAPHTKALQDQLRQDLELLADAFPEDNGLIPTPTFTVIKGRSSYLCKSKLAPEEPGDGALPGMAPEGPTSSTGAEVVRLAEWAATTETGDRADVPFPVSAKAWEAVSTTATDCTGKACPFVDQCFAESARKAAAESDIIVVNQAFLAAWMKIPFLLPDSVEGVVVDESHEFHGVVAYAFGARVSVARLRNTLSRAKASLSAFSSDAAVERDLDTADTAVSAVDRVLKPHKQADTTLPKKIATEITAAASAFRQLGTQIRDHAEDASAEQKARKDILLRTVSNLVEDLTQFSQGNNDEQVVWVEKALGDQAVMRVAQFDVADTVFSSLIKRVKSVVFTSATLAINENFNLAADEYGFSQGPWRGEIVASPFDYQTQGLIWTPTGMPEPSPKPEKNAVYLEAVADVAVKVARAAHGRTLVLCTSRKSVEAIAQHMEDAVGKQYTVLSQTGGSTVKELAKQFAADPHSILVGTRTFWTGVSFEGDTCVSVVIDKLPFPSPSDPIIEARCNKADRERGRMAGFKYVSLAEATLTLVQGVGRQIRTVRDRGVVVICDPRVHEAGPHKKFYGSAIRRSLPPFPVTSDESRALALLEQFNATSDDTSSEVAFEDEADGAL